MGFFCFFVVLFFKLGLVSNWGFLTNGLGLEDGFGWAFFLLIRLRTAEGASIFVTPNASQKVPISLRDWALSEP